jgi:prolyl 4-hydroxylase
MIDAQELPISGKKAEIWAKGNFLDEDFCSDVIKVIDKHSVESTVTRGGVRAVTTHRTSSTCYFHKYDTRLTEHLEAKIADLTGLDPAFGEHIQGQKYKPDQYFREHTDFFTPESESYRAFTQNGGQRTYTVMVYLNTVCEGGETVFPELGFKVKPVRGLALIWNNLHPDGRENFQTIHRAEPPKVTNKYVLTKWYRKLPYTK